ncbi:hypothetical protein ACETK8_20205 (plasmid) [Brevundimonas staleyi]|uniref:Lipoprotein n=1 Tax=Brevundimonas staleyi TaxID=74326 RepID=A0ABW0FPM4_9CAUL
MKRLVLIVVLSGLATGCASTGSERPAVCDGRHRRPANLYGSYLSPPAPPIPASPGPSAAPQPDPPEPTAPPPATAAPPHDQFSALPSSYPSC